MPIAPLIATIVAPTVATHNAPPTALPIAPPAAPPVATPNAEPAAPSVDLDVSPCVAAPYTQNAAPPIAPSVPSVSATDNNAQYHHIQPAPPPSEQTWSKYKLPTYIAKEMSLDDHIDAANNDRTRITLRDDKP